MGLSFLQSIMLVERKVSYSRWIPPQYLPMTSAEIVYNYLMINHPAGIRVVHEIKRQPNLKISQ
jgi:hypothetical protein